MGQGLEQGFGRLAGAGVSGFPPFARIATVEFEGQYLEAGQGGLLMDLDDLVDVALGQIAQAETAYAAATVLALDGRTAAGAEQECGQQGGGQGSESVHDEQLTSIFLAQSGGSAA
ncbi:hypothetical protein [Thiobacillus sp.]|uniref:hypothetical protein n=1 Tax=Thiobacillus sp. TaxID=924 RepID=UPI0025CBEAD5|nr:hypothetical protein [Thiobacillus sp.]